MSFHYVATLGMVLSITGVKTTVIIAKGKVREEDLVFCGNKGLLQRRRKSDCQLKSLSG